MKQIGKQIKKRVIRFLSVVLCAILVWAVPGKAIAGDLALATKTDHAVKAGEESENNDNKENTVSGIHIEAEDYTRMYGIEKGEGQISNLEVNDWMRYEFQVTDADKYCIVVHGNAEKGNTGRIVFRDESNRIAEVELDADSREMADYKSGEIVLASGDLQLTAVVVSGELTIDWLELKPVDSNIADDNKEDENKDNPVNNEDENKDDSTNYEDENKDDSTNNEDENKDDSTNNEDENKDDFTNNEDENKDDSTNNEDENRDDSTNNEDENKDDSTNNEDENKDDSTNNEDENKDDSTNNEDENKDDSANNEDENKDDSTNNEDENKDDNKGEQETTDPTGVEKPEFDTSIPKKNDKIIFQLNNRTNGAYKDDQIYWCILGYRPGSMELCYVDEKGELKNAHTGLNTIKVGDRKCADIFNTLAESKYVYMPSIVSGRMYISYGSPVYITINVAADGKVGFAGPDMNNTSDPNREVYFEFMEFTIGSALGTENENPIEYWGNTTRVDNFCFPVVTRLIGENGSTNGTQYETYDRTVGDVGTREQIYKEFKENAPNEFKDLAEEYRIVAPCKGSFNEGKANANYFKDYINQFWNKFSKEDLKFECQGGEFVARTNGDYIEFTEKRSGQTGKVKKPNTQEVLEGKGAFDSGSSIEKVFEAQLCAAFNRGVALNPEDWYTPEKYYQSLPYNYYSKFWHEHGVDGFAYGFCYDDVHEQATLLHFTNPKALVIDLKW